MDFSFKKSNKNLTCFTPLLSTVSKLYYTYYHLRLLMIVCIVLIWFLLTVFHESGNLDAIFIVCRKIKNKISKLVFSPTPPPPPPPILVKSQLFFNPFLTEHTHKKNCLNLGIVQRRRRRRRRRGGGQRSMVKDHTLTILFFGTLPLAAKTKVVSQFKHV